MIAQTRTEEAFAALAEQYSEDEGSNAKGGLYENVYQGQMVEAFDAFCFAGHQPGDTGIVYGESGSYAGYHVMYYVGEGELYSNVIAEEDLRSNKMDDWLENADITVIPGAGEALVDPIDGIRISKYTVTVTVKHSDDTAKDFIIHTDASSLREALEQENLIHGEETEFGLYVLSVDGETADQDKEEWWCLTCDGEVMPTGVDDTKIVNGAHYEITLTKGF